MDAPVVSVGAHLFSVFTPEVEDNIKLFLRFANNVSATLEMSTNCFVNLPRWHVSCTGGTLMVENWACDGKIVALGEDGDLAWDNDIIYTEAGPTRTMAPRPAHTTKELSLPEPHCDWADYYKNIVDVLENGAELLVRPEQAIRVMKVMDLIFAAHESSQFLTCNI